MRERDLFTDDEFDRLYSNEGDRIDIANRFDELPSPFFVELRPGKATLFCPGANPGSRAEEILDRFAAAPMVEATAAASGLSVVRGKDFVDVSTTKYQGVQAMKSLPGVIGLDRLKLCIGDSENDAGLFAFCRETAGEAGAARFFVGADAKAVGADSDLIHLKGGYVSATACIFAELVGTDVPSIDDSFPEHWRDSIRARLGGRSPSQVLAITDMTGCHLHQAPRHFPEVHRENLRRFLRAGGQLWLVSGDALPVIAEHFIRELGPLEPTFFVISSGGFRIDQVAHGATRPLWVATDLSIEARRQLLREAVAAVRQSFKRVSY